MAEEPKRVPELESTAEGAATIFVANWSFQDRQDRFFALVVTSDRKVMSWSEGPDRTAQESRRALLDDDEMKKVQAVLAKLAPLASAKTTAEAKGKQAQVTLNFSTKAGAYVVKCTSETAPRELRDVFGLSETARKRADAKGPVMFSPFDRRD